MNKQSSSFELLQDSVQKWIWRQGWTSLKDIQENSIPVVLRRDTDVIISAATAGGKTEAAFLPILSHCANKIGESYFRTPRTTIKSFLDLLSVLEQYPDYKWNNIIASVDVQKDVEASEVDNILKTNAAKEQPAADNDEFANFSL